MGHGHVVFGSHRSVCSTCLRKRHIIEAWLLGIACDESTPQCMTQFARQTELCGKWTDFSMALEDSVRERGPAWVTGGQWKPVETLQEVRWVGWSGELARLALVCSSHELGGLSA